MADLDRKEDVEGDLHGNDVDGEMLAIVDGRIVNGGSVGAFFRLGDKMLEGFDLVRVLSEIGKSRQGVKSGEVESALKIVRASHGEGVVDIIMNGRFKVDFLIDTDGGSSWVADQLVGAAHYLADNGGRVNSWVLGSACSAGATIFEAGRRRYAKSRSSFMWHHGDIPENKRHLFPAEELVQTLAELKTEDISRIRRFFRDNVKAAAWSEIESKIDKACADPENPRCDVNFRAVELLKAGVLHRTYRVAEDLLADLDGSLSDVFSQRVSREIVGMYFGNLGNIFR